jgi:T4-like virus Myoviridae tail sheath stabiliser
MPVQFNYDGQIRRFVIQFIRMLSNFQVEFGKDENGNQTLQTIPVYYGDQSRQAAMILRGNSENTLNAVPAIAVYIGGLAYDRNRLQNPYFEDTRRVREQSFDPVSQSYVGSQEGIYTVERLMPAPYKLTLKADIWTSNTEQKHQIIEQILPLFNPALEIQSTDNYLDWTSLSAIELSDVSYTSRSVPMMGDDTQIDIANLTFELPIWLTLPAKVKKGGVVAEIIASIYDAQGDLSSGVITVLNGLMSQQRFTPLGYEVVYTGPNILTLYTHTAHDNDGVVIGEKADWNGLINMYGKIVNGISQARLQFPYPGGSHEIVGTVAMNPVDPSQLIFSVDDATKPANTLPPVNAIIDPFTVTVDSNILTPALHTRYLILNPIGSFDSESAAAWAGPESTQLVANANDIIEWNGSYWTVSFDSQRNPGIQYVSNLRTTVAGNPAPVQYRWYEGEWTRSYEGLYKAGEWSLVL